MKSYYDAQELSGLGPRRCGTDARIHRSAGIYGPDQTEIGGHVHVDDWCILASRVVLGSFIHLGVNWRPLGSIAGVFMRDFSGLSYNVTITANTEDYAGNT